MKIIITEDQVNLLNEGTNKSVRLLKKYYDIIGVGGRYEGQGKIRTDVSFLRKDSDDDLNHSSFPSYGFWVIGDDDQLIFRSVTLPKPENIPLMEYIGNTDELKEYLKDLHREEAEDILKRINHRRNNPLNEEENDKPDWLRENTKVKNLLKKVLENKEFKYSFKDKWEDLDGHIETYTFYYHIEILNAIGVGSDTIARVQVIIDDILLDGESVYDGWVEIGYSNNVWYINNLENHLDEEFFDVFPFDIYVNFYGHDEER